MLSPRALRLVILGLMLAAAAGCATTTRGGVPPGTPEPDKFLFDRGTAALNDKKWLVAREFFKQVTETYTQSPYRPDAKLGIGDTYLGEGTSEALVLSINEFREYLTFYPTNPRADYAQYKLAMGHFRQMRAAQRDQTETRETVKEFTTFVDRYPGSKLMPEARAKLREAQDRLSEASYLVGFFYFRQRWYPGAIDRFKALLKDDPAYSRRDAVYFYLGESLVKAKQGAEALPYFEKLAAEFEQSEYLGDTQKRIAELKAEQGLTKPPVANQIARGARLEGPMRSVGIVAAITCLGLAASAPAQTISGDHLSALQVAVACASPTNAADPGPGSLTILGAQSVEPRSVFDERDLLVVNGGTAQNVALGQEYFVRSVRTYADTQGELSRALRTSAWLKVIALNETTAIASITYACGPIYAGDFLEPFVAPAPPANADRVDTSGELDFAQPARVMYSNDERQNAAIGDFVLIDQPADRPATAGERIAFYRDPQNGGMPLVALGEGVVVSVGPSKALVRVNQARGAIENGDYAVRRK